MSCHPACRYNDACEMTVSGAQCKVALLGAHVSAAGGLQHAIDRGLEMGCETIQIFTRNQMQWSVKPLSQPEIQAFLVARNAVNHTFPVLVHDSYLINLGSPEPEKLQKSRDSFLAEVDRCEQLGVDYLVFHPGAHLGQVSEAACLDIIADSLNQVTRLRPGYRLKILIENTAGQGTNVGYRFEHIAYLLARLEEPERFGVCLDTCHTLAAGYPLNSRQGYDTVMSEFDKIVGLQWIQAFHLNDAKKPLGSRLDRHEDIGRGFVGKDVFRCLVNDRRFANVPMVLETPGRDPDYQASLVLLKGFRHES